MYYNKLQIQDCENGDFFLLFTLLRLETLGAYKIVIFRSTRLLHYKQLSPKTLIPRFFWDTLYKSRKGRMLRINFEQETADRYSDTSQNSIHKHMHFYYKYIYTHIHILYTYHIYIYSFTRYTKYIFIKLILFIHYTHINIYAYIIH